MHLQEELRQALLKRGYVLVLIGGGITGDIQVNDTHLHAPLKAKYRELEIKLMLKQLKDNPKKIPSPDRNEMMDMISEAMKTCRFDRKKAFKTNFMTNNLNGSEDLEVSEKLYKMVGKEIVEHREKLLKEPCPKDLKALLKRITPPKVQYIY